MKKRFLPISLLLTIIVLAQTSFVARAHGDNGKYTPRNTMEATVQSFMKSIRANQETGLIDPAWLVESSSATQTREGNLNWTSLGPDNYGSLTRAIVYDKKDATNQTIYIGTMGGGVFKSTNGGITWKSVSGNMMVNTMVQTEDGTLYVGTGDGRSSNRVNGLLKPAYTTTGFNGEGIYKSTGDNFEKIESTSEWTFVNELATYGDAIYAATSDGLFVTNDGENWTSIIEGIAHNVEINSNGTVLALVNSDVYTYNPETSETSIITNDEEGMLPSKASSYKIIAASPSNPDYVYVAYIDKAFKDNDTVYSTGEIYITRNFTQEVATWDIAFEVTELYKLFGSNGLASHMLVVHPSNPKKIMIGGDDLWVGEDKENTGIYRMEKISNGNSFQISNSGGLYIYNYSYIHTGIQSLVFNPKNDNEFFIGSDGGIFKGSYTSNNGYTFEGKNRYFIDENNHTSVTRMFSVGFDGNNTVLGGSLDHGTIKVIGNPTMNNVCTGNSIFPNDQTATDASATYGPFNSTMSGGSCAISTINSNAMFITTRGDYSIGTSVFRSQTAGNDYDKENFSYTASDKNANGDNIQTPYIYSIGTFRTPIAFNENYNDSKSVNYVKFYADTNYVAGDTLVIHSMNAEYPFNYVLTENLANGDSIEVQDIISSTFVIAAKTDKNDKDYTIFMTRDALISSKKAEWWKIATLESIPNAIALSQDGDIAFVGTLDGKLYKYEGISDARDTLSTEGFVGTEDYYIYVYDSIPDENADWDTTYIYDKVIIDSIIGDSTYHYEYIIDSTIVIDTVWKYTTDKIDSTLIEGKDPIQSLISSTEIDATAFNAQAITSINVDPQDKNNVLVTLGNYGNDNYVFYSTDGGASFASIQGNLPKVPAYSGIIEKGGNGIIIGTEKGIYSTTNGSNWSLDGLANIPVMDLKQQLQTNHDDLYKYLIDEVGDTTVTTYRGVYNEGAIFAATYGRGLFRCNNYLAMNNSDLNVEENTLTSTCRMSIYPNPIVDNATIRFDLDNSSNVSYQIYDLSGRLVSNVSLGKYPQGTHNVNFNVSNLNAGTYIIRVQTGATYETTKILVY